MPTTVSSTANPDASDILSIVASARHCPLNHGLTVVDQLLAALTCDDEPAAFDTALDLRWQLQQPTNADAVLRDFFRLRALVEERHYLACYRLRRWLNAQLVARVVPDRHQPAQIVGVRLDASDYASLCAQCLDLVAIDLPLTPWARVRFAFAAELPVAAPTA
jgi:hypothetical protein